MDAYELERAPMGTTPGQEHLMREADGAFERKHGYPPLRHKMAYPPLVPGMKQLRHGHIAPEYER